MELALAKHVFYFARELAQFHSTHTFFFLFVVFVATLLFQKWIVLATITKKKLYEIIVLENLKNRLVVIVVNVPFETLSVSRQSSNGFVIKFFTSLVLLGCCTYLLVVARWRIMHACSIEQLNGFYSEDVF